MGQDKTPSPELIGKQNFLVIYKTLQDQLQIQELTGITVEGLKYWLEGENANRQLAQIVMIYEYTGKVQLKTKYEVQGILVTGGADGKDS